jgi:hypothetical protein
MAARDLQPIRDWTWSGHTLQCLKVLNANENRAAIGFLDEALPGRRNDGVGDQCPFGFSVERPVIVHRFGSLDAKQEHRYYVGIGPRKFQFKRPNLGWTEANQLKAFWEAMH